MADKRKRAGKELDRRHQTEDLRRQIRVGSRQLTIGKAGLKTLDARYKSGQWQWATG